MATQYVYFFGGGRAEGHGKTKDELGGKGVGLAEMTAAGLPVPPGFTISTRACKDYLAAGGQLRTLERSGSYVIDDDLNLGMRWLQGDVDVKGGAVAAVARAYLTQSVWASTRYEDNVRRGDELAKKAKALRADGVVFAAPSFCDPALLDQPPLQKALTKANIPFISFKYAENTGQFQGILEQAGTFSDSIKLWGAA